MVIRMCLFLCAIVAVCQHAHAQSEGFMYQGYIEENGEPANGNYQIFVRSFANATGGDIVGSAEFASLAVVDGLFNAFIPDGVITPDARWLDFAVKPAGMPGADFEILSPRQYVTSAPFASIPLTSKYFEPISNGILYGDGNDVLLLNRTNRIGSEYFGIGADTSGFAGMYISTTSFQGQPFYGYSAGGGIDAYHVFNGQSNTLQLQMPGGLAMTVESNGDTDVFGTVSAQAFSSSFFFYESPRILTTNVPLASFQPDIQTSFVPYTLRSGIRTAYIAQIGNVRSMVAPLVLPDNARLTFLGAFVRDVDPNRYLQFQIRRYDAFGGSTVIGVIDGDVPNPVNGFVNTTSFSAAEIDNANYTYQVEVAVNANGWNGTDDLSFRHVYVQYEVDEAD